MGIKRPDYPEFKVALEKIPQQPLSSEEELVAEDFWRHWDELCQGLASQRIRIHTDTFYAPLAVPELKRYHMYKGLGKMLILVGVVLLLFSWKIAAGVLFAGLAIHVYGDHIRNTDFSRFADEIATAAMACQDGSGMIQLCAHYMAGTIDLETANRRVHLFEYPSNVVTGDCKTVPRS